MDAVRLERLRKSFGTQVAVDGLDLAVPEGSLYGFIGPNGSGKTTTLRLILGILLPDQGTVNVLGHRNALGARDEVGYLPEERGLYPRMTVLETLRYAGRLKGMEGVALERAIAGWLARLGLETYGRTAVRVLSKGTTQKVQLLAAIVSRPRLLVLDEPFSGLDPVNADAVRDAILALRREGTTVIYEGVPASTPVRFKPWPG